MKNLPGIPHKLHEPVKLLDRQIERCESVSERLQVFRRALRFFIGQTLQNFCRPSGCTEASDDVRSPVAIFLSQRLPGKLLDRDIVAFCEDRLKLNHESDDVIRFRSAFGRQDVCILQRGEDGHRRTNVWRGGLGGSWCLGRHWFRGRAGPGVPGIRHFDRRADQEGENAIAKRIDAACGKLR